MAMLLIPKDGDLGAMGCAYSRWFNQVQARGIVPVARFEMMIKNWHWGAVKHG